MTRRTILKVLAAIPVAALPSSARALAVRKFGRVTAGVRGRKLRVTVDGMNVTNVGFDADDIEGWVNCRLWQGYPKPPGDKPERLAHRTIIIRGNVVIEERR